MGKSYDIIYQNKDGHWIRTLHYFYSHDAALSFAGNKANVIVVENSHNEKLYYCPAYDTTCPYLDRYSCHCKLGHIAVYECEFAYDDDYDFLIGED